MAIQVSYPGVYIEEFTPAAPIQGVGTSTAAFIGTALSGPIDTPRLVQSWDEFVAVFGGFVAEPPDSYLAPAVFGFFLNGGTACYVVRAGAGPGVRLTSLAELANRRTGVNPPAALIATAGIEGPVGDSLSVRVDDSSRLRSRLTRAGSTADGVFLHRATTTVTLISTDRTDVTVADTTGFAPGDRLTFTRAQGAPALAIVDEVTALDRLTLRVTLPPGNYTNVRSADLAPGQREFRVDLPQGFLLGQALPRGSLINVSLGTTTELCTVESSINATIRVTDGLVNVFSLSNAADLPKVTSLEFDLAIADTSLATEETFAELSMNPNHPSYWRNAVNSNRVTLAAPAAPPAQPPRDPRPKAGNYPLRGGQNYDRAAAWSAIHTNPNGYLALLKPIDSVSLVAVPGATDKAVQQAVIAHCEAMRDRFAILDSIKGIDPRDGIELQRDNVTSALGFAALYYPWIIARNPLTGADEAWPPSGHIAGCYVRTDAERGVHKAPANANIRGSLGLETRLTDEQQGRLNLKGINVLRVFQGQGQPIIWGTRTTASDTNWQYVNIRRLFIYLEESIQQGIRGSVFEPNNTSLWQKLKRTIGAFLTQQWRDGALFGKTVEEAFYVRIDEVLNPDNERALGRLTIEIGVRPSYPAEFIVVRIGIWQGGSSVSES